MQDGLGELRSTLSQTSIIFLILLISFIESVKGSDILFLKGGIVDPMTMPGQASVPDGNNLCQLPGWPLVSHGGPSYTNDSVTYHQCFNLIL